MAAGSYTHVEEAYLKIRLLHPAAKHVVCAYFLEGTEPHYDQDFCDDGEHGTGKHLLSWLQDNQLNARAIFVVRYYSQKIGPDCFKMFTQAAESALKKTKI